MAAKSAFNPQPGGHAGRQVSVVLGVPHWVVVLGFNSATLLSASWVGRPLYSLLQSLSQSEILFFGTSPESKLRLHTRFTVWISLEQRLLCAAL